MNDILVTFLGIALTLVVGYALRLKGEKKKAAKQLESVAKAIMNITEDKTQKRLEEKSREISLTLNEEFSNLQEARKIIEQVKKSVNENSEEIEENPPVETGELPAELKEMAKRQVERTMTLENLRK